MSELKFWKVQSVGNDFVLVHDQPAHDWPALALQVSRRRYGIGSDGLLVVGQDQGDLTLRMFNPDGTEDFCGNGLRCAAWHARRRGWVGKSFNIRHLGKVVPVTVQGTRVRTVIGAATLDPKAIPVKSASPMVQQAVGGVEGTAISTGSAHFIVFVDRLPEDKQFLDVSPRIEHDPLFPERVSVIWTQVVDDSTLAVRIWERGAGETLGCGTGASAAVAECFRRRGYAGQVTVRSKGGDLTVEADAWDGPLTIESEAQELFEGVIPSLP